MNKITKIILGLVVFPSIAVGVINAVQGHSQIGGHSTFSSDVQNNEAMLMAEYRVRQVLKDPDSAKFGSVHLIASTNSVPQPKPETDIVCGYVNAKNSFGAYTGASRFIAIPGVIPAIEPSDPDAKGYNQFFRIWNRECAGKQPVASL